MPGRVSTLEAVVAMLRELGEPESTCEGLLDNLRLKVDALRIQNHKEQAYGTHDTDFWRVDGWEPSSPSAGSGHRRSLVLQARQ